MQNGFACIDDLRDAPWGEQVGGLGQRGLRRVKFAGWKQHCAQICEFPWAYAAINSNFTPLTHLMALESGYGVTPVPFWLGGDGFRVVGFDMDRSCEARWHRTGDPGGPDPSRTKSECGDILHLPLADATVDIAHSVSAIEHTSDPVRAAAEVLRVLEPGGGLS